MASLQLPADVECMTRGGDPRASCSSEFPGRVSLACSFQKEESVLLDMLFALEPKARVFALDTHDLFPETYALWREVERALRDDDRGLRGAVAGRRRRHGDGSGRRSPTSAARSARSSRSTARSPTSTPGSPASAATSRRRARTRRSSAGTSSTSSGRRTRSPTGRRALLGVHPRARPARTTRCTTAGYASIGCTHCTQPGAGREGRWAGTGQDRVRHCTSRRVEAAT